MKVNTTGRDKLTLDEIAASVKKKQGRYDFGGGELEIKPFGEYKPVYLKAKGGALPSSITVWMFGTAISNVNLNREVIRLVEGYKNEEPMYQRMTLQMLAKIEQFLKLEVTKNDKRKSMGL